jgi:hypothetical protein
MTSQNLTSKCGSLESLKILVRCGLRSFLAQSRWTVAFETPRAAAMVRTLQRARRGGGWVTSVRMRRLTSTGMVGLRPLRGRSCKAPSRSRPKRARVLPTALKCRPTWRAIWRLGTPWAASRIAWARSASCRLPVRAWAKVCKRWRSSSFNSITAAFAIDSHNNMPYPKPHIYLRDARLASPTLM